MRHCKFLKIFLLSSLFFVFIISNKAFAKEKENLTHSDLGLAWHEYQGFGVDENTWKTVRNSTVTLYFNYPLIITSSYYIFNNCYNYDYFTLGLYDENDSLIGNIEDMSGSVPSDWVGKKLNKLVMKFSDISFNSNDFINERFPYFYIAISTANGFPFGSFVDFADTSFDIVDHNKPIEIPSLPTAPNVPDDIPDIDFDIDNNVGISDILNNIVEGIKQFFENLLRYGMTILLTAVSVASFFWFTMWLWKKVKIWLSSV